MPYKRLSKALLERLWELIRPVTPCTPILNRTGSWKEKMMVRTSSALSTARWRMTLMLSTATDEHASAGAAIGGLGAGGLGGGVMLGAAASDGEGAEVDEVISGAGVNHLNIRSKHLGASSSC